MGIWDDHDHWIDEIRKMFNDDENAELSDNDLLFTSNLAAKLQKGELGIAEVLNEIQTWVAEGMGYTIGPDDEAFELELSVNYPDLIEVTDGVKENLVVAGEPGLADGLVRVFAHPEFHHQEDREPGVTQVAMKLKMWFGIHLMNPDEHRTMGWAISQAVREHVGD